jgi:hypothetical protein
VAQAAGEVNLVLVALGILQSLARVKEIMEAIVEPQGVQVAEVVALLPLVA